MAALLSIWNRLRGGSHSCDNGGVSTITETDIVADSADLIKIWGQRGTLHVYHADDWPLITACVQDALVAQRLDRVPDCDLVHEQVRRIAADLVANAAEFVYADRHDPVTSRSIRMLLTLGGHAAWPLRRRPNRITNMRPRQAWTSTAWRPPPAADAVRQVALRYFAAYGPASELDFRYMMGLRASASRRAVTALLEAGNLTDLHDGLLLPTELCRQWHRFRADPVPLRMLYCFDPIVLAHARKTWLLRDDQRARVWSRNGIVRGVVLVDGRVAGTWAMSKRQRAAVRFGVSLFNDAAAVDEGAIRTQLAGIAGCLGIASYSVEWE